MAGPIIVPPATLSKAFKLVHQILSTTTKPGLSTKEIVREGLALYDEPLPEPTPLKRGLERVGPRGGQSKPPVGADQSLLTPEERQLYHWKKIQKKFTPEPQLVPEGHPFISTSFLKRRIFPILQSQDLVVKRALHADPASPSSSTRVKGSGPTFVWSLSQETTPSIPAPMSSDGSSSSRSPRTFSAEDHWSRLINGHHPGQVASLRANHIARAVAGKRENAIAEGRVKRTEEEIRSWEGRLSGVTTDLERAHLNKRREGNRAMKEWSRQNKYAATDAGKGKPISIKRFGLAASAKAGGEVNAVEA